MISLSILQLLWQDIIHGIIIAVTGSIVLALIYFCRNRIEKWHWKRYKIKPVYEPMMSTYEKKVLPDYVEVKPGIKVQLKKEDLPAEPSFGYVFVPGKDAERAIDILLACIPVSSSLRSIRVLFDEKLRRSLFDYLSYRLALEIGKEDRAVAFRDKALREYPKEYEIIERLYEEGKLTGILFNEAIIRFRRANGKPSTSDMQEFSRLVKKLVEIDVMVIRIGEATAESYVEEVIEKKCGAVLLARGRYTEKALDVSSQLCEKSFELFSVEELGFSNPEIGTWHFVHPKEHDIPLMRIWLKRLER
jgi:hypothetical protein